MNQLRNAVVMAFAAAVATAACSGEETTVLEKSVLSFDQVSPQEWERLSNEKIFFGHQSVGQNLVDGVRDVLAAHPNIRLKIVEARNGSPIDAPGFYHTYIGENGKPSSKVASFRDAVSNLDNTGIALMKFCYVDVNFKSDAKAMFEEYRRTVEEIRASQPGIKIVHVTLPLTRDAGTIRYVAAVVRRLPTDRQLNLIRHQYNEMLRQTYGGKEPIFDLARLESIEPNGAEKLVSYKGNRVPVLSNAWTDDGGHLNLAGRRRIAEAFLATLVSVRPAVLSRP